MLKPRPVTTRHDQAATVWWCDHQAPLRPCLRPGGAHRPLSQLHRNLGIRMRNLSLPSKHAWNFNPNHQFQIPRMGLFTFLALWGVLQQSIIAGGTCWPSGVSIKSLNHDFNQNHPKTPSVHSSIHSIGYRKISELDASRELRKEASEQSFKGITLVKPSCSVHELRDSRALQF